MTLFAHVMLLGWVPLVLLLFALLPSRTAVVVSLVGAWLFLPMSGYPIPAFPDYTKLTATTLGVLLGTIIFDGTRILRFRPSILDVPAAVWCVVPVASSVSGGYGLYDGLSVTMSQLVIWGLPYLIGRLYFNDLAGLKELAVGLFIGGVVYTPLVLFEVRMSPQLHTWLYGFHQHDFVQSKRGGGWRPTVFMQHGLAVGMQMTVSALLGVWLWITGATRTIRGIPMMWLVLPTLVAALLCKSTGAAVLLVLGLSVLFVTRATRLSVFVAMLVVIPALYMCARTVGGWSAQEIVALAELVGPERADSLRSRLNSENGVWHRVQGNLWLGTGRFIFGAADPADEVQYRVVADGYWIIALGRNGVLGLAAMTAMFVVPLLAFLRRYGGRSWGQAPVASGAALMVCGALFLTDLLFNAMMNPLLVAAIGGLAGAAAVRVGEAPRRVRRRRAAGAASQSRARVSPGAARP